MTISEQGADLRETTFTLDSDATPQEIKELYKFSPVYNMVSAGVPIKVTVKTSS